jgi:hypothetical protein
LLWAAFIMSGIGSMLTVVATDISWIHMRRNKTSMCVRLGVLKESIASSWTCQRKRALADGVRIFSPVPSKTTFGGAIILISTKKLLWSVSYYNCLRWLELGRSTWDAESLMHL